MISALVSALDVTSSAIDAARWEVRRADTLDISSGLDRREQAARARAAAYVFTSAALERCLKDSLNAILGEINAQGVALKDLRPSLLALIASGDVDFIRTSGKTKALARFLRVAAMFDQVVDSRVCAFVAGLHPVDGRTLRAPHFETVWAVFGFSGPPLPNAKHALALADLATGRNEVAHGSIDPVSFGRAKATSDVTNLISQIEDIMQHLIGTADHYVTRSGYKR
jgi:hypothetical protein